MKLTAVNLLNRCLDELDCDIYADPVTIELVNDIRDYLKTYNQAIVSNRVISSDHGVTITAVEVNDITRAALNTGGARLPSGK